MHIMPGDQSPLNGGLLRAMMLAKALPETDKITYCFHDADAPWLQTGGEPRIIQGTWAKYRALDARLPFCPDAPDLAEPQKWTQLRNSLKIHPGLAYLAGNRTTETIHSVRDSTEVGGLLRVMHDIEVAWAGQLAGFLGRRPREYGRIPSLVSEVVPALKERVSGTRVSVTTTSAFWREHGVCLQKTLPKENYWIMDRCGRRTPWDGSSVLRGFLVPRSKARMLETVAHGITDCFAALPYLDEIQLLRDRYLPGFKVPYVEVGLEWSLPHDPLEGIIGKFVLKKQERIATMRVANPAHTERIPTFHPDDQAAIRKYWIGRPTTLAYELLGGELTAILYYGFL